MDAPEPPLQEDDEADQYPYDGSHPSYAEAYSPDGGSYPPRDGENEKDQPDQQLDESKEQDDDVEPVEEAPKVLKKSKRGSRGSPMGDKEDEDEDEIYRLAAIQVEEEKETDPVILGQIELIEKSTPSTDLELALSAALKRKETHATRLTGEIIKLKQFISKRKQTYKRKRKDDGAPTRALSAYNIYIQDRFANLAKENENALKSEDKDATMKRVPPASLVAATGNAWKTLSVEEKQTYEER